MKRNVRVLIWGFGAMGSGMAEMLCQKIGVEIAGVCDIHPERQGKRLSELINTQGKDFGSIIIHKDISTTIEEALTTAPIDIALLATDSLTQKAFNKIMVLISNGINVISTAEEMAYPMASEPQMSKILDESARKYEVSVLGTGINPGLIMDLLVVLMTGASIEVDSIQAERVNSLSPYGPTVMEEQGVGLTPEQFKTNAQAGKLIGHIGFRESINMIAKALGLHPIKPVEQSMTPIISSVPRKTKYTEIEAGQVAGCTMKGFGTLPKNRRIEMNHPQQIEPEQEGIDTGDYIRISGTPDINLQIKPEVPGGIGTIAMCVNMIPQVINASPGLKTMIDLPVPRAILGDMRDRIDILA